MQDRGFINECICAFSETHSNISFTVRHSPAEERGFDICVASETAAGEFDRSAHLFEEEILLAAALSCPLSLKDSVNIAEALDYPLIMLSEEFPLSGFVRGVLAQAQHKPSSTIICQDPHMAQKCIGAGLGVSFIPMASWQETATGNVKFIHINDFWFHRSTYLYWNSSISGAAADFRDMLLERAKNRQHVCPFTPM